MNCHNCQVAQQQKANDVSNTANATNATSDTEEVGADATETNEVRPGMMTKVRSQNRIDVPDHLHVCCDR